jgi:hypothetical protein
LVSNLVYYAEGLARVFLSSAVCVAQPIPKRVSVGGEGVGTGQWGVPRSVCTGSASGEGFQNWERCEPVRGGQGGLGLRPRKLLLKIVCSATCGIHDETPNPAAAQNSSR